MKSSMRLHAARICSAGLAAVAVAAAHAAPSTELSEGEVRKVDREAKKVTLKHGEIKNLQMPPMSMVFHVNDPALLDSLKPGDKIRFRAENEGGKFTVIEIHK